MPSTAEYWRRGPGTWDDMLSVVYAARCWAEQAGDLPLMNAYLLMEDVVVRLRSMDDRVDVPGQHR